MSTDVTNITNNTDVTDLTFCESVDKNKDSQSSNEIPLARVSTNIARSRTSELNRFYDQYIGPPLENLPKKNLPMKQTILQRYLAIRSKKHNISQRSVAIIITKEVVELWNYSAIPHKDIESCTYMVQNVISKWVDSKQEERTSHLFQENLNTLLDLRPSSCSTLPALKKELQTLVGENWMEDYEFFKGQLKYPQDGFISPTSDLITEGKRKRKAERESKADAYKKRI